MELLWIVLSLAALVFCLVGRGGTNRLCPSGRPWPAFVDTGPQEPCWTEAVASDGRYLHARAQCVHDALLELDARARRGDFPFDPHGA